MQIEDSRPRWGILFGLLFLLGNLAVLPFLLIQPQQLPLPLKVQNFVGDVELYSLPEKKWFPIERGDVISPRQRVRTGKDGELDLQIGEELYVRLTENTEVQIRRPKPLEKKPLLRLYLRKGSLFGVIPRSNSNLNLQVVTPVLETCLEKGIFHIRSNPKTQESWVGMLKGKATVWSKKKYVLLRDHEKSGAKGKSALFQPSPISQKDWSQMKKAYQLPARDPQRIEKQSPLRPEFGTLFLNVSGEHVRFDPNLGYLEYTFLKDTTSPSPASLKEERIEGEGAYLKLEYDVFPRGSFVEIVFKTQDLDLGDFSQFSFQARSDEEENIPDTFRIQFKSGQKVLLTFNPHRFLRRWSNFEYSFRFPKLTPVTEISFGFSNQDVGPHKRGVIYLRELMIQ